MRATTFRSGVLLVMLIAAVVVPSPAHGYQNLVVSQPDSARDNYVTEDVNVLQGQPALYLNVDPLASHNVVARDGSFTSGPPVGPGAYPIEGIEDNAPGVYEFYCTFHPGTMVGTITIQPL